MKETQIIDPTAAPVTSDRSVKMHDGAIENTIPTPLDPGEIPEVFSPVRAESEHSEQLGPGRRVRQWIGRRHGPVEGPDDIPIPGTETHVDGGRGLPPGNGSKTTFAEGDDGHEEEIANLINAFNSGPRETYEEWNDRVATIPNGHTFEDIQEALARAKRERDMPNNIHTKVVGIISSRYEARQEGEDDDTYQARIATVGAWAREVIQPDEKSGQLEISNEGREIVIPAMEDHAQLEMYIHGIVESAVQKSTKEEQDAAVTGAIPTLFNAPDIVQFYFAAKQIDIIGFSPEVAEDAADALFNQIQQYKKNGSIVIHAQMFELMETLLETPGIQGSSRADAISRAIDNLRVQNDVHLDFALQNPDDFRIVKIPDLLLFPKEDSNPLVDGWNNTPRNFLTGKPIDRSAEAKELATTIEQAPEILNAPVVESATQVSEPEKRTIPHHLNETRIGEIQARLIPAIVNHDLGRIFANPDPSKSPYTLEEVVAAAENIGITFTEKEQIAIGLREQDPSEKRRSELKRHAAIGLDYLDEAESELVTHAQRGISAEQLADRYTVTTEEVDESRRLFEDLIGNFVGHRQHPLTAEELAATPLSEQQKQFYTVATGQVQGVDTLDQLVAYFTPNVPITQEHYEGAQQYFRNIFTHVGVRPMDSGDLNISVNDLYDPS